MVISLLKTPAGLSVNVCVQMALMGAPHDEEVAERVAYRRADVAAVSHATSDADQKTLFPTGSHWDESLSNPLERGSLVFPPVPVLHADFSALLAKFHGDEEYRKMVYLIIGRLLTPAYIVSLTCNAAFGAFWRVICERRKDERRDVLLARISKTMPALGTSSLVSVRKWLDESYNRAAEIESIVAEEPAQVRLRGALSSHACRDIRHTITRCSRRSSPP